MQIYQSKLGRLPGTSYREVLAAARREYHAIQKKTPRRQAYVRSRYFKKDKIFINQFWVHLDQKVSADRLRRLRLFACGIEVIRNCPYAPQVSQNPNKADEALYRYTARTRDSELFYVQIRANKVSGRKDFMSVFPAKDVK